jgi:hypothetical protein
MHAFTPPSPPGRQQDVIARSAPGPIGLSVLSRHDEAIPVGAQQLADATCGVKVVERSLSDT